MGLKVKKMSCDLCVVGGGISGMSAAIVEEPQTAAIRF
jgi:succinate dehydrogenase/fumarate reductase flavoprotein subunit